MGRLILCHPNKAEKPYFMKSMSLNLYTIEELCYYLYDNLYFIEESMISDELIDWIDKELKLTDLVQQLNKNRGNVKSLIMIILKYAGYISDRDMEETNKLLTEMDQQSDWEKSLARATHYLQNKKYVEAILEYKKLYGFCEYGQREKVLNNIGVAYAKMFYFREAARYFKQAYEFGNNQDIYKQFLYAVAMAPKEETEDIKEALDLDCEEALKKDLAMIESSECNIKLDQLNEVLDYKKENQIAQYYKGLESLLADWKKEYISFNNINS
ncbi:hypothetical protein [Lachnotalea glycerini]|jgi:hypothetical protein|uniref:Uncharacterized protein n=1 Tax=Lachnotalea glycerini TaxID=1763509 RepID=A0A371JI38_9FIRM|nr:hypothetical protein [Lachnotalea glycerini]RDY32347.1 hypothetical protein CG710_005035 [Lachnotalea glycerini]